MPLLCDQVVANGEIADAPASAGNLADLLSLDVEDAAEASATATSAVTALQDLLSSDLSAEVAAAGNVTATCVDLYVVHVTHMVSCMLIQLGLCPLKWCFADGSVRPEQDCIA